MSGQSVYTYLRVRDGAAAIKFYTEAFGAELGMHLMDPADGRVGHAELSINGTVVMLSDAYPEYGISAPGDGPRGYGIHLHVDDCDAVMAKAVAAGATVTRPATDQFYGERSGAVLDPFGHEWLIGHSLEQVSQEEAQARWNAMVSG